MDTLPGHAPPDHDEAVGRIDGWNDFADRVRAGMAVAAAQPAHLWLMDSDFAKWPLGERSVMEAFSRWALAGRVPRCTLIASTLDELPRRHPRWLAWRHTWAHRTRCLMPTEDSQAPLPTFWILEGKLGLRLLDPLTGRGVWTRRPADLVQWRQDFDAISQQCEEGLPPTTLGL